jgi:hypothetical protein
MSMNSHIIKNIAFVFFSTAISCPTYAQDNISEYRQILDQYCVTCHNSQLKTANLLLDRANLHDVSEDGMLWEKVVRKLRTGSMPPAGMPRPEETVLNNVAAFLEQQLDIHAANVGDPGKPIIRRLNRTEYGNAVSDLLAVEFDEHERLPNDDSGYGFDTVGEALSISPLLTEAYLSTARKISQMAVGDEDINPYIAEYKISRELLQNNRMSEDLPFGTRGGTVVEHFFPLDGEYLIKIRLQRNNDNYIRGLGEPHQLDVRLDGALLESYRIGGEHVGKSSPLYSFINKDYIGEPAQENYEFTADDGLELRLNIKAGTRKFGVAFLKMIYEPEGEKLPRQSYAELFAFKGGEPGVDTVSISGPFDPSGTGNTPSRSKIFNCFPNASSQEADCASKILSTLARRAYRRPLEQIDVETLLKFYAVGYKQGGFEEGIRTGIQGILVSPHFLFRIEREPKIMASGIASQVNDLDLASRLSFFIWSSIPDEELLTLAEIGQLTDPIIFEEQVKRLLSDQRSKALVQNFTEQWLGLRKIDGIVPDPKVFPYFDDSLRSALKQEMLLLAENIARQDRSLLEFLSADYTYVNQRLAEHYNIPDIYGSGFRKISLADMNRKGILGKGSVLTVTSYANRTSPTLRGKWVMDNILGTPPPEPPPNIPALGEEQVGGKTLTMRERMEKHRVNPICATCHKRMDPLGFAMDNFNAIGEWREYEGTTPIDPTGVLPDGRLIAGPAELTEILLERPEQFLHTVTEKLLIYALGRGLTYHDQSVVRKIIRESAGEDYRWSAIILGIVNSMPFQMRRSINDDI